MVSACFPQARALQKGLSRLKAMRGRYPRSSRSVKRGKKIAIGGSITDTTQDNTRQIPSKRRLMSQEGAWMDWKNWIIHASRAEKPCERSSEGTFAPEIVSQKTRARSMSIKGIAVKRPVKMESNFLSLGEMQEHPERIASQQISSEVRTKQEVS